jgi:hypothetical protein
MPSDLDTNSFDEAADATQNEIDISSDLNANLFHEVANVTQNEIDMSSDLDANSLLDLLMQLRRQ